MRYEIYVDNIGRATDTWDKEQAIADFNHYVDYVSKGETVSFFMGDELIAQYYDGEILAEAFVKTDGRYITGFTKGYKREITLKGFNNYGYPILDKYGSKVLKELNNEVVEQFPEITDYYWELVLIPTAGIVLKCFEDIPSDLRKDINKYLRDTARVIDKRQ